jgi:hypothetical protein
MAIAITRRMPTLTATPANGTFLAMSDVSQGEGWWQASDGKWYPPQAATPPPAWAPPPGYGPPGYGPPGYGPPGYGPPAYGAPAPGTEGMAIGSLISGIVGVTLCPLVGSVLALVFGYSARRRIRESGGAVGGDGIATAGVILGYIGIGLVVLVVILIAVVAAVGSNSSYS